MLENFHNRLLGEGTEEINRNREAWVDQYWPCDFPRSMGFIQYQKKEAPPASWVWSEYKIYAIQPWWLFAVTPRLWTIHRDGEVLMRLSKHGPGHESPLTIPEFFRESVNRFGSYPALASKKNGRWEVLNYNQYYEACRKTARAMLKVNALFTHSFVRHILNHSFCV